MNNRDPFNLRRGPSSTPFSLIQQTAAQSAQRYTRQIVEHGQQAFETGKQAIQDATAAAEGMSFNVPRNVPNFQAESRRNEDEAWGSSGRSRFPTENANGAGVTERIGGMFGDGKKELPMYKDKPYNYAGSSRRAPWFRRKTTLAIVSFVVFVLYWSGMFSTRSDVQGGDMKSSDKLWKSIFPAKTSGVVDWEERRERVRDAFKLSWDAYEKYAWGYDEFHPVSKNGRQMVDGGMGWIIVDALDTLILMNLTTQLSHAREWVSTTLNYEIDHDVNTFETTIRMLGGLLSAHYLSTEFPNMAPIPVVEGSAGEDLYLEKATDLADRLLGAYESQSGVPYASINLKTLQGIRSHADGGASSTAEATSLQLEMKYVAKLTGEANYWHKTEKVMEVVDAQGAEDGLVPIFINADRGVFQGHNIRLGSRGDSYYAEYLIKQYLQTSKQEPVYLDMWEESLRGIRKHLITYSAPSNLTILAERPNGLNGEITPKMDHLVCFMPGTIALAATGGLPLEEARKSTSWGQKEEDDMDLARELMKTCWGMYKVTATGLAPEITYFQTSKPPVMMESGKANPKSPPQLSYEEDADWRQDYIIKPADTHNLQRPETVESLFYMWRITGEEKYREWGWEMFQSFVKHTLVEDGSGFTSINDVNRVPAPVRDNMESFWLAETLKYFYLLFGPGDVLPLDQVVLNTEAHALPRFELGKLFKTGWERKSRDGNGNIVAGKRGEAVEKKVEPADASSA
ncbi:glycoside hydrolase family 47 protein [Saccharata proteae CBS 121410]|uniref:alpha-1,2-Mannosidase n=1 Tax=Saccharata proteae CBS 121410 TaxID=1314787 RepID=A0A9P4HZJ9_9PEZI|nr:glycoside hydrolase family 47 protein [Saccharata proteae CBS 121410]